jgi:hypothetical protein
MNDPNVIVRLTAITQRAEHVFCLSKDSIHYKPPDPLRDDTRESFSRESTASECQEDGISDDYSSRLQWTFEQRLKKDQQRLSFGSDPHRCDIPLGRHKNISGLHFYITLDREKGVMLYDVSKWGMIVTYDGKAGLNRHESRWILFDDLEIVEFVVKIDKSLCFRVEIPSRATRETPKFNANLDDFLQRSQDDDLLFGQLALYSQETTAGPTQPLSPRRRPIYLPGKQIGKGGFGKVHEVRNVSTGAIYAAKSFMPGFDFEKEVEILRSLSHVSASDS